MKTVWTLRSNDTKYLLTHVLGKSQTVDKYIDKDGEWVLTQTEDLECNSSMLWDITTPNLKSMWAVDNGIGGRSFWFTNKQGAEHFAHNNVDKRSAWNVREFFLEGIE